MKNLPVYGGLDYHQGSIQVCVLDQQGRSLTNRRCRSELAEVVEVVRSCGEVRSIAIESCCGAAEFADQLRQVTGWEVRLAHPGYVNRMKHNPDKSDHSDARLLADLGRVGYVPQVWLPPRSIRELRTLVRRRQAAVDRRKATKLRILSLLRGRRIRQPNNVGRPWTQSWYRWIREVDVSENDRWILDDDLVELQHAMAQIQRTEARLRDVTAADPMIRDLLSIQGIGEVTAWTLRSEIATVRRFRTSKQLCRFCGTSPRNASSGERVADSGLIRAGNPYLKAVIFQAAHRLIQHTRRWSEFAARLVEAGKPKNVAVAAVANRWVRWLFHRMKEFEMVNA
jgi:transposase